MYHTNTRGGELSEASVRNDRRGRIRVRSSDDGRCQRTTLSLYHLASRREGLGGRLRESLFVECLKLADGDRDVDLYHWSSAKFSSTWYDTLSVLVAKGRAQVSVAASSGDWSKRIRDMQYTDHDDYTVGS